MERRAKYFTLGAVLVLVICVITMTGIVQAQTTINAPAIPEFTIKYFDYSYDVAPIYSVDPNTDETVVTVQGYHVDNRTVEFTIKNQPFTTYTDQSSGKTIDLFYNIKYKLSDGSSWTSMFGGEREFYAGRSEANFDPYVKYGFPTQTYTGEYTTITFVYPSSIPVGAQVDFQVQALEGYTECSPIGESHIFLAFVNYVFYGEKSGWSSTQTVPLSEPTPSVPEYSLLSILPLLLMVFTVAVVLKKKRQTVLQ